MLDKFKATASHRVTNQVDAIMVIGLGRFGLAVARSLVRLGHEVLAVDANKGGHKGGGVRAVDALVAGNGLHVQRLG